MLIPLDQRRRLGAARWMSAAATLAMIAVPEVAGSQEAWGTVRGRVVTATGAPAVGVTVRAQSAELTLSRGATSNEEGHYVIPHLPPGRYVITFEDAAFVTVRRVTRVGAMETVIADATMPPDPPSEDVISISLDGERFPRSPGVVDVWRRTALDRIPIEGGLYSAMTLASGTQPDRDAGSLVAIDGAPVRFGPPAGDRPLLEPGPAAVQEVSVRPAAVPTGTSRFTTGAISVVTRAGGDRVTGSAIASLTGAGRLADNVFRADPARGAGGDVDFGVSVPIDGRRTWLFAAGSRRRDPVDLHARLTSLVVPSTVRGGVLELKATHAFDERHRIQALLLQGSRDWDPAPPEAAVSAEGASAMSGRGSSQRVWSAGYTGDLRPWSVTALATAERWRDTSASNAASATPAVWDLQSGGVAGGTGVCSDCRLDERTNTTLRVTAARSLGVFATLHHLTVGAEWSGGDLEGPDLALPGIDIVASRFLSDGRDVYPVLGAAGASWIVLRQPAPVISHSAQSLFVSDDWRPAPGVSVHAGLRWDRQRLEAAGDASPLAARSGLGPRLSAAWQSPKTRGWTLYGGLARYEADVIDLVGAGLEPAGDWFAYQGPPINPFGPVLDAVTAASAAVAWLQRAGGSPSFSGAQVPLAVVRDRVRAGLAPTVEWSAGASRRIRDVVFLRADLIWRRRRPLDLEESVQAYSYTPRIFERAESVDLGELATRYTALATQLEYDLGVQVDLGARYTLSRLHGVPDADSTFPAGFSPAGDLAGDRRHRLQFWGHAALLEGEEYGTVELTVLQSIVSGQAYAAASWIDRGPGFGSGAGPAFVPYYFTNRGDLRGETARRTDVMTSYARVLPGTVRTELTVRFDILNLFANDIVPNSQDYAVARTALTAGGDLAAFNPSADTPQPGVHWDFDPRLLDRSTTAPETLSRAYRLTVGVRF